METQEDSDDKRWLTYWIVFGFFMAVMDYLQFFLDYLPVPRVLISAFFLFIYCPLTNGYEYIYNFIIKKFLKTYETYIDKYIEMASNEIYDKAKRAKNEAVNTVVEELQKQK